MGALRFVGADVSDVKDIIYKDYVDTVKEADPTDGHIDSVVAARLASYATKAYADTRDALLATRAYIDTQDNLRLKLTQKGAVNGIVPLDAVGRVNPNYIDVTPDQSFLRGPWSPAAYQAGVTEASGITETTIYTCGVTDPGYAYKLVVFGTQETVADKIGNYPTVLVRQGSTTGPIVAQGTGAAEYLDGAVDLFERVSSTDLGADWTLSGATGHIATPNGHDAAVVPDNGFTALNLKARYTKAGGDVPSGDYMKISFTVADIGGSSVNRAIDMYSRWQSDNSNYVQFHFRQNTVRLLYVASGGAVTTLNASTPACTLVVGDVIDLYWGVLSASAPRRFQAYKNDVLVYDQTDGTSVTTLAPTARGWGFGFLSFGATASNAAIGNIQMRDPMNLPTSEAVIVPVNIGALSPLTGATTLYVSLLGTSSTGGKVSATTFMPNLHILAVPV